MTRPVAGPITGPITGPGPRTANYRASRELVTPRRLREFFAPRSIALVGASDNSGWARFIVASSATAGFTGPLVAVHPYGALRALEVNPLWVNGDQVKALDVLVVTAPSEPKGRGPVWTEERGARDERRGKTGP